jgi:hypothetical protein
MINKIFEWDNISYYEDPYMEKNTLLRGRKGNSDIEFVVGCPDTISILYLKFLSERREKILEELL